MQKELPEEESRKTAVAFGEDFIDAFSVITGINLRTKSTFYVNVISHITLMLNRAASSTPARNPIIDILLENYKGTINVCQIICRILTEKFRLPEISFDEICYLMLYIPVSYTHLSCPHPIVMPAYIGSRTRMTGISPDRT